MAETCFYQPLLVMRSRGEQLSATLKVVTANAIKRKNGPKSFWQLGKPPEGQNLYTVSKIHKGGVQ